MLNKEENRFCILNKSENINQKCSTSLTQASKIESKHPGPRR